MPSLPCTAQVGKAMMVLAHVFGRSGMIRELKTFIAVSRLGSFAAAARQVNLTQSAVSAQMKALEDALGMKLFERTARAITVNAQGERVLPLAEQMLSLFDRMRSPEQMEDFYGKLNIGAISSVQVGLLPDTLRRLKASAPLMTTELVPGLSLDLIGQLESGELDAAIIVKPSFPLPKDIVIEPVASEPFVLVSPKETNCRRLDLSLGNHPFIQYSLKSSGGRQSRQFLKELGIEVHCTMELDDLDAIARMVESGLGVSLLPFAGMWIKGDMAVDCYRLEGEPLSRDIVLAYRYVDRQQPKIATFRQVLVETSCHYQQRMGECLGRLPSVVVAR